MATTVIANEISDITKNGQTPDPNFIVSAQKFVVANVPKNLLMFGQLILVVLKKRHLLIQYGGMIIV